MTTTTIYSGMEPGNKNSSRVLRPPGGASNISFGTDEEKAPTRKNKMASNIFAEPDDPHAHRRNNPPGGKPTGVLCGEPSAPLRRAGAPSSNNNNHSDEANVGEGDNDMGSADVAEEPEAVPEQREEAPQPTGPPGQSSAAGGGGSQRPQEPPRGQVQPHPGLNPHPPNQPPTHPSYLLCVSLLSSLRTPPSFLFCFFKRKNPSFTCVSRNSVHLSPPPPLIQSPSPLF